MKTKLLVILCVLFFAGVAMVGPASADGTSTITGNPVVDINLRVAGGPTDWALVVGPNTRSGEPPAGVNLTISCSTPLWTIGVSDKLDGGKPDGTAGRMADYTPSTYNATGIPLYTNMTIIGVDGAGAVGSTQTDLLPTNKVIETGYLAVNDLRMYPVLSQPVLYTDQRFTDAGRVYRIIVTFTGTPGA